MGEWMLVCGSAYRYPETLLAECEKSVDSKIYETPGRESLWGLLNTKTKIVFEIHESADPGVGFLEEEPNLPCLCMFL